LRGTAAHCIEPLYAGCIQFGEEPALDLLDEPRSLEDQG
jgi:hypothetical protein